MLPSNKLKIFYIHGFASSINSSTYLKLCEFFPDAVALTYDYSYPKEAIQDLKNQIESRVDATDHVVVIGSSFGGWFTEQLTDKVVADFIMYNPQTEPLVTLYKFKIDQSVINRYESLLPNYKHASRNLIISIDDLVVDPVIADIKYKNIADMNYTAGGHRMTAEAMSVIVKKINFLQMQIP